MFDVARLRNLKDAIRADSDGADQHLSTDDRRRKGAFFTPMALVELVVSTTLEPLVRELPTGRVPDLVVLDPACGDGRFLEVASRLLVERLNLGNSALSEVRAHCTVGIERDPAFAALAQERLPSATIHCAEALFESRPPGRIDAVVGNPPYLRSIHLGRTDEALRKRLRGRLAATSHGEWDLYAAFLERSFDWLHGEGQVGLVVPSRWLTAAWAGPLRQRFANEGALRGVIDFGSAQVFESATTYASVTFLSGARSARAHVARWRDGHWATGTVETDRLNSAPWDLSVGQDARTLNELEEGRARLADMADIVKGAGTNCDPVFAFSEARPEGATTTVYSRALGEHVCLESRALRSCYRGRDVGPAFAAQTAAVALVPYDCEAQLWSVEDLESMPLARDYLFRCRARLEARERGRFAGERFYCFGRPQNMRRLMSDEGRVLVPDVAKGGRAAVCRDREFALDSVYAIFPREQRHLAALAAVLASPSTLWWLSQRGVLLRGGYVRMKTAFLRDLPVPDLDRLARDIEHGTPWQNAVALAYKSTPTRR